MFPAAKVAQNVDRCGVLVIFVFIFKFCYVPLNSLKVSVTVCAEFRRQDGALRIGPRSATVDCMFSPSLPCSVATSHISSRFDKDPPHLSSSVKVSFG